ncbi:1652_t:CDS:2 [Ambispora leptoticha]|uniref:rRNA-processing protein EFG1 n=1 Tax=Ambispora leptoticha TaxID=144679 RepID=A0A9N8WNK0_9GLOM|nr:1652_t:CDS:2 [Ambispora leptoticha]
MPKEKQQSVGALTISRLSKQIRDTKRILEHGSLPPNLKVEKERRLKALEDELLKKRAKKRASSVENEMRQKYRMVKFLEEKKVTREINKLTKLKNKGTNLSEADIAMIEGRLKQLYVDYNYIKHFPVGRKYISLYSKIESKDPNNDKKRQEIREQIKESIESMRINSLVDQYRTELEKEVAEKLEKAKVNKKKSGNSDANEGKLNIDRDDFFDI